MDSRVVSLVPGETRDYVDQTVKDFARGLVDRNTMMYMVAAVLKEYGIRRLPLGSYEVAYFGEINGLPVVHLQGRGKMNEVCPACGSDEWRYINTEKELPLKDYDVVMAFCMDCSCFYRRVGWKVDQPITGEKARK